MEASRSKKTFFISECLVNQNLRAYGVGNMKGEGPVAELINLLVEKSVGLSVVSCPEIYYEGLKRKACGKARYRNPEYKKICDREAKKVIERYKLYLDDGYKIGGFICVNGSPSCGIDFCYDGLDGHEKILEPGTFVETIQEELKKQNLELEFIGVRMKDLDNIICRVKEIISHM